MRLDTSADMPDAPAVCVLLGQAGKARSSNIEMLRIFAMWLIVVHHFIVHGALGGGVNADGGVKALLSYELSCGGKLGVDIFVLITGFYMIEKQFKAASFFHILYITLFYALVAIIAVSLLAPGYFSQEKLVSSLWPNTLGGLNWFAVAYLGLYLFIPFLNKFAAALAKEHYKTLLVVGAVCFALLPTFLNATFISSYFVWFCYLYLCAGYLRKFGSNTLDKYSVPIMLVSLAIVLGSVAVFWLLPSLVAYLNISVTYLAGTYSPFLLLVAVTLFWIFKRWDIGSIAVVNTIAKTTFGIYLIHDNRLLRVFLWRLFEPVYAASPAVMAIGILGFSTIIFLVCAMLEMLRAHIAERIPARVLRSFAAGLYCKMDSKMNGIVRT